MKTSVEDRNRCRPMTLSDLHRVTSIEQSVAAFPWTSGNFSDCLDAGYECWVMEMNGQVGAYLIMSVGGGDAHLLNLAVESQQQRLGLGRHLLRKACLDASRLGASRIQLEVRPSNEGARALYKEEGFKELAVRKDYYRSQGLKEDAFVMELGLKSNPD